MDKLRYHSTSLDTDAFHDKIFNDIVESLIRNKIDFNYDGKVFNVIDLKFESKELLVFNYYNLIIRIYTRTGKKIFDKKIIINKIIKHFQSYGILSKFFNNQIILKNFYSNQKIKFNLVHNHLSFWISTSKYQSYFYYYYYRVYSENIGRLFNIDNKWANIYNSIPKIEGEFIKKLILILNFEDLILDVINYISNLIYILTFVTW